MAKPKTQRILTKKQLEAIQLYVYEDYNSKQVAAAVGVSENTMVEWNKKEVFQQALKEEVKRKFNKMAVKATKRLNKLLDSDSETIALGAIKETLSKAGYDAVQEHKITETTINVTIDDEP